MTARFRLGIDIGGTFTDLVLMDESTGETNTLKVPSVPSDPAKAVLSGIKELVRRDRIDPRAIHYFVHGTTIALNTIIERSGTCTGLLVTKGFRDILEIGRLRLPDPTNYFVNKTQPLVPRKLVREIDERLLSNGREFRPLDLTEVDAAVRDLIDLGAQSIAVCFMHSYKSDRHERQAVQYIREAIPELYVCGSAEIWPQQREFERALVTVMNAHIGNRMRQYFDQLTHNVKDLQVPATVLTTKSNGGIMTAQSASQVPVETLLSGPSAGVMGALHAGRLAGFDRIITLDIGGTSADVAIINQELSYGAENTIGEFPLFLPAIDISSIGAGGGSIAWLDGSGLLKVGPQSAGADPGPACYARGGIEPTLTDAYVCLGLIRPENFLGGRQMLDAQLAEASLSNLGRHIGLDVENTAASVVDVTTANMYSKFIPVMAKRGVDPRDFALLAYGGAGPTHAFLLAREVGMKRVLIPASPGTLCALGSLIADVKSDFIRTIYARTDSLDVMSLDHHFFELERQAHAWLTEQQVDTMTRQIIRSADMRYVGQSFDLTVTLPAKFAAPSEADSLDMNMVCQPFHDVHDRIYGYSDPEAAVEIINIRVTIIGETPKPRYKTLPFVAASTPRRASASRAIIENRQRISADVFQWPALMPGDLFAGPAIVEAVDTTVYMPTGFVATIDAWSNIVAEEL